MAEETQITLASPGFPIYIPLVVCEWNITLLPENNVRRSFKNIYVCKHDILSLFLTDCFFLVIEINFENFIQFTP